MKAAVGVQGNWRNNHECSIEEQTSTGRKRTAENNEETKAKREHSVLKKRRIRIRVSEVREKQNESKHDGGWESDGHQPPPTGSMESKETEEKDGKEDQRETRKKTQETRQTGKKEGEPQTERAPDASKNDKRWKGPTIKGNLHTSKGLTVTTMSPPGGQNGLGLRGRAEYLRDSPAESEHRSQHGAGGE
ncbi:uncharacterized protein [Procambarus clarkii]|uniref:uncharacterized protein n=1 Tax=Procambarus clarkii TaxID=6728 RepID=UPI00374438D3